MIKKIFNYSPNFELKKRRKNQIQFLILHYTGMEKETNAIKRKSNIERQ